MRVFGNLHDAKLTFSWNPGQRHADSRTAKHLLPESTTKSVESGTYDVICQFCTVKGMVVESEVLKAQNCALSKLSLAMRSKDGCVKLPKISTKVDGLVDELNPLKDTTIQLNRDISNTSRTFSIVFGVKWYRPRDTLEFSGGTNSRYRVSGDPFLRKSNPQL